MILSGKPLHTNSTWTSLLQVIGNDWQPKVNASVHHANHSLVFPSTWLSNDSVLRNQTAPNEIIPSQLTTTVLILLVSLMTLITVTGNLLVILAFICDPRIRTYSNCFILNLSIADLLVGLIW